MRTLLSIIIFLTGCGDVMSAPNPDPVPDPDKARAEVCQRAGEVDWRGDIATARPS